MASLEVKFDAGDAPWLAGYSHALMALCDFMLAHDFHATFDVVSHRFFPKSAGPLAQARTHGLSLEAYVVKLLREHVITTCATSYSTGCFRRRKMTRALRPCF